LAAGAPPGKKWKLAEKVADDESKVLIKLVRSFKK
jgi:hypothetical protein